MLSIIICSRKADISEEIKHNIASTIGCEYELCVIDNSRNDYTIFTAYNEGVRCAKGDILCFMHEDLVFHSKDWGQRVEEVFNDKGIGCLGVIGSKFLPNQPAAWWLCHATEGYLIQGYRDTKGNYKTFVDSTNLKPKELKDVVVVDGCWFCIMREMFDAIRFDEETYSSFHCYDMDICMQVIEQQKRVVVTGDIAIEHRSMGNVGKDFYNQLALFYNKWKEKLPYSTMGEIPGHIANWVSEVIANYQKVVQRNDVVENSKSYRAILAPMFRLKKK